MRKSSRKYLMIAVVLIILLLVVGGIFIAMKIQGNNTSSGSGSLSTSDVSNTASAIDAASNTNDSTFSDTALNDLG